MRRPLPLLLVSAVCATALAASPAAAQYGGQSPGQGPSPEEQAAAQKKKDEWSLMQAPLPGERNAGPCPFVKVLYDAGRYQEFQGGRESSATVGFTGEIQGVESRCKYKTDDPIQVQLGVVFALGRGPTAQGDKHVYRYWVAVTRRNSTVLAKEYFDLPVKFDAGQDRVTIGDEIKSIVIPRANKGVSGTNFEILVGFDVTPQMAAFNREGKRFRIEAVAAAPNNQQ